MQKVIINSFRIKHNGEGNSKYPEAPRFIYGSKFFTDELIVNLRARGLAIVLFFYFFIENGTLGLLPERFYFVYRNVRVSDFILYITVFYSFIYYKEYKDLLMSKSFLLVKIILGYFILEYFVSCIKYGYNPIETFFRLKGLWSSFLIFPFLLLLKRNGFGFFIKLVFPVAVISNVLYILSAVTGIAFLGGIAIVKQRLSADIEVYRVFGGTFYGDIFYLGFVYYWITKQFKLWQLSLVVLFAIPHILAFGRMAWVGFAFTIILMLLLNSLRKRQFRILVKQAVIMVIIGGAILFGFIKFIPESNFYFDALKARLMQGQDDVNYSEGTYGTRVLSQNSALIKLWSENDVILGIGMHPLWVIGPESRDEVVYYGAFSDVGWPAILAAYGLMGFILAIILQIYLIFTSFKIIKKIPDGTLYGFFVTAFFAKLLFDTFIGFSYIFVTTHLWGFFNTHFYIALFVYSYEMMKRSQEKQQIIK